MTQQTCFVRRSLGNLGISGILCTSPPAAGDRPVGLKVHGRVAVHQRTVGERVRPGEPALLVEAVGTRGARTPPSTQFLCSAALKHKTVVYILHSIVQLFTDPPPRSFHSSKNRSVTFLEKQSVTPPPRGIGHSAIQESRPQTWKKKGQNFFRHLWHWGTAMIFCRPPPQRGRGTGQKKTSHSGKKKLLTHQPGQSDCMHPIQANRPPGNSEQESARQGWGRRA